MAGADGQWSIWSSWSICSLSTCRKTRNRTCNNPAPLVNGHMCEGNSMDVDFCDLSLCLDGGCISTTQPTSKRNTSTTICPDNSIHFTNSCYFFEQICGARFADAQAECQQKGAHLAYIENKQESSFIKEHIKNNTLKGSFWIGLSKQNQTGKWTYSGTEKVTTFIDWHPGEPSNYLNNEDCVELDDEFNYEMNDLACKRLLYYVCEKEMSV